ncbi:splicing coactivator subunit-like protein [Oryza sativa Japonica Group]|uniref:Splicing coactivator subunit-like protein n=1 Tax=Oryza sativa subsp. japonica TaxID=39947 RepID=Q5ZCY7_ORYSJ|nr:splicing coactivator subunit-like protein [Oryza sativa Japonica Group]BAD54727.1 splicing coactivator subunit-like protein [Oryza sativa Japonica Group]
MWKYGSALQQRPELNPYSGRGATSHNWHAPKPHRKQVLGVLKEEESREGAPEGGLAGTADGSGAPAPRWSPPATNGAAERHPRERREGGNEGDGPRLTPGQRRRRERRTERRETAARLGMTMTAALRRSASETEARTRSTAMRRCRGRWRRAGRRTGATSAASRRSAATAEREEHGASTDPTARASGERRKRKSGARGAII